MGVPATVSIAFACNTTPLHADLIPLPDWGTNVRIRGA